MKKNDSSNKSKNQLDAILKNLAIDRSVRYNPRIQLTKVLYTQNRSDTTFTAKILYNGNTVEAIVLNFENSSFPLAPDFFCPPDLDGEALIYFASGAFLNISEYTSLQPLLSDAVEFYNIIRNDQKKREELGCPLK